MSGPAITNPVFAQVMVRVKDPKKSVDFYQRLCGMKFLAKLDFPEKTFSLYFLAYTDDEPPAEDATQAEKARWLWARRYMTLELTHNYGTENQEGFSYHNGNSEPRGFGHIGITSADIYGACKRFEAEGCKIVRQPGPFAEHSEIAFVADPDGYWIELIQQPKSE
eukprot:TRINITY_DN1653_c0_g1_i2.p2 TRINITY_DN1653_c0_g1~~TRINITY_DN1653_c0_g1_i2.p2  ORF type:complete len:165 (-),score=32.70 TRINITY_DN1653_c0_g1_i2:128-622(-)